jgi:two-component system, NarL family, sensor histidine kinase UhpB
MLAKRLTLQMRLVAGVAAALIVTLTIASALVYWHATSKIETEMQSALAVGERLARNEIEAAKDSQDVSRRLNLLIAHFDGDRHVQAALLSATDDELAKSRLTPPDEGAPNWFVRFVKAEPKAVRLPLGAISDQRYATLVMQADPTNEVAEAWSDITTFAKIFATFAGLTLVVLSWMLSRAIKPIQSLLGGYEAIGDGDYSVRAAPEGSPELQRLCFGFNDMASRLGGMADRNQRLSEQLERLQDEERAELARDLHDELSPLLFATGVDTAMMADLAEAEDNPALARQAKHISESLAAMKRIVSSVLGRLRPALLLDQGLTPAIDTIVASWERRHPSVTFHVDIADLSELSEAKASALFFVLREAVSNALRHAMPSVIDIVLVENEDTGGIQLTVGDNGTGIGIAGRKGGFGIVGMRERMAALGGELSLQPANPGPGLVVRAQLPVSDGGRTEMKTVELAGVST